MDKVEIGKKMEKVAIDYLKRNEYRSIELVNSFYDIECEKEGIKYYIEVKSINPENLIDARQHKKLFELIDRNKKSLVLLITKFGGILIPVEELKPKKAQIYLSLEGELWVAIENYRRKNNLPDISSTVEHLLQKVLKDRGELK